MKIKKNILYCVLMMLPSIVFGSDVGTPRLTNSDPDRAILIDSDRAYRELLYCVKNRAPVYVDADDLTQLSKLSELPKVLKSDTSDEWVMFELPDAPSHYDTRPLTARLGQQTQPCFSLLFNDWFVTVVSQNNAIGWELVSQNNVTPSPVGVLHDINTNVPVPAQNGMPALPVKNNVHNHRIVQNRGVSNIVLNSDDSAPEDPNHVVKNNGSGTTPNGTSILPTLPVQNNVHNNRMEQSRGISNVFAAIAMQSDDSEQESPNYVVEYDYVLPAEAVDAIKSCVVS